MRIVYIINMILLASSMVPAAWCVEPKASTFPLNDVKLLDSGFKTACDLNIEVLLRYDTDRLIAPFLKEAGLPVSAEPFSNWAGLDGHIAGHYLSALAISYAATGDKECKRRVDFIVGELKRCQDANGDGYIGGIPDGKAVWEQVRAGDGSVVNTRWVPWYNLHKTFAGLRDACVYAGNSDAGKMFIDLCDWGIGVISNLSEEEMEKMLDNEFGGMNEVYVDAYEMTGDRKYLDTAIRFSHKRLFDSMVSGIDNLDNMHANTQVPKAVGYQRVAEVTGDKDFTSAAGFFWETVVKNRSLSFGGNSRREHFPSARGCREYIEEREGPESCNTYNMLKLSEGLFRMNPDAVYADFYERALYNHIRSTQHPGHGGYVYFTSARPRHYRVYSAPDQAMWCCVGTGMENHGKYGEFIYASSDDGLYVNLFIPSELSWKEKGLVLRQETDFPAEESTRLVFSFDKPCTMTLKIRRPAWLAVERPRITVNGEVCDYVIGEDSYLSVRRRWETGDTVRVGLPMKTYVEEMPNVRDFISILHGPVVLAARTGKENLDGLVADEGRWSHIACGRLLPLSEAPIIIGGRDEVEEKLMNLKPVAGCPLHYTCPGLFGQEEYAGLEFEPFAGIHDSRYSVYWQTMTGAEFDESRRKIAEVERVKLELDRVTVDVIECGEQQPEADHRMESDKSFNGVFMDESYRGVGSGGFVSYEMATGDSDNLRLRIGYWGNENGDCRFDIIIDGTLIASENLAGKWNKEEFTDVSYMIPRDLLKDKKVVRIELRPKENNTIPGVYNIRMLRH